MPALIGSASDRHGKGSAMASLASQSQATEGSAEADISMQQMDEQGGDCRKSQKRDAPGPGSAPPASKRSFSTQLSRTSRCDDGASLIDCRCCSSLATTFSNQI